MYTLIVIGVILYIVALIKAAKSDDADSFVTLLTPIVVLFILWVGYLIVEYLP